MHLVMRIGTNKADYIAANLLPIVFYSTSWFTHPHFLPLTPVHPPIPPFDNYVAIYPLMQPVSNFDASCIDDKSQLGVYWI